MNKIKRINISDFRIYEDTQEFNFENNGSIANLVVLYAPNGYGKTSFYDAIEWCFSDKINRIGNPKKNEEVKELDYNEEIKDKIILTNRQSYKRGKLGEVQIITENGQVQKTVAPYTRKGTQTKYDYRDGKYTGDIDRFKLIQLPALNILSQDQIDSFLRHTNAEEKFDQLDEFANQVKDDLERFKQVDNVYKTLSKEIIKLGSDLDTIVTNIKLIKVDDSTLTSMNDIIGKIVKKEGVDLKLTSLSKDISSKELEEFKENLIRITNLFTKQSEQHQKKIEIANELLKTFGDFQKDTKDLGKCINTIDSLNNKKKLYADKTAIKELTEKQRKTVNDLSRLLKKYQLLFNYAPKVKKILGVINKEDELIKRKRSYQQKANTVIAKLDKRVQELEQDIDTQTSTVVKYQDYIRRREEQEVEQKKYDHHIDLNKKTLLKVDEEITPLEVKRNEVIKERDLFTQIINNKKWGDFNKYANKDYSLKYELYVQSLLDKKEIDEQLVSKDKELKASGSLQENLNRIKKWGADFSVQTNTKPTNESTCPLCNTPFSTLQLLLDAIEKDRIDALNIPKIEDEIRKLSEAKGKLLEQITNIEVSFTDTIHQQVKKVNEQLESINKKLEDLAKLRSGYALEIKTAESKIEKLVQKESNAISRLTIPKNIKAEEYSQYIQNQVKRSEQSKSHIKHNINSYRSLVRSIKSVVSNYEIEISKSHAEIFTLQNNNNFLEFTKHLKECNIDTEEAVSSDFKSKYIDVKEKEKEEQKDLLSENEGKINILSENITNHKCEVPEELISGKLVEEEIKRKSLSESINSFTSKIKLISSSEIQSLEQLNKLITAERNKSDTLKEVHDNIVLLTSKAEIVDKQINKKLLEKQQQDLEKKIGKYKGAFDKIEGARNSCIAHIQRGIETTFNKKVINEIYNRIEPHPSLSEIDFRAEIGDKGPRLAITAKGGGDEINPNLFLSAGQVNILSLSIFLAKAYEYGSEVISTIFLDDPIQNLSDINILSFIDVLRTLTQHDNKQIVISTHDEKFFRLLQNKMPEEYCNTKFIEFDAPGVVKRYSNN
ncbi:AAA family ATPase [Persicobacter diffluens]|uniref:Rad50/SbcC-type AAA domain-containing protein n=1 Tax=Persicobacter diffluens TaxID=981 RepID=A0AAN4VY36_9BACT|nr:hypothetical protein PEDI_17380 [Persicobacter diffluens]